MADWILDLLAKLGPEDDAYDAVALIVPRFPERAEDRNGSQDAADDGDDQPNDALIEVELLPPPSRAVVPSMGSDAEELFAHLQSVAPIELRLNDVPDELAPARFLNHMIRHVLDNSPITRHEGARELLAAAQQAAG